MPCHIGSIQKLVGCDDPQVNISRPVISVPVTSYQFLDTPLVAPGDDGQHTINDLPDVVLGDSLFSSNALDKFAGIQLLSLVARGPDFKRASYLALAWSEKLSRYIARNLCGRRTCRTNCGRCAACRTRSASPRSRARLSLLRRRKWQSAPPSTREGGIRCRARIERTDSLASAACRTPRRSG
jgi:hypothetical protein